MKLLIACLILLFYIFAINFWLGDDAYITFRVSENFVNGYGLRWNPEERVQSYTNPLWMFLTAAAYAVTGQMYWNVFALSAVLTAAAVFFLFFSLRRSKTAGLAMLTLFLTLLSSKAFVDYSGSGLEFSLAYLLTALFLFLLQFKESGNRLLALSAVASLSAVNRLDSALLFYPILGYLLWQAARKKNFRSIAAISTGALPIVFWLVFSLVYYGFLFPNTYYAKLNSSLSQRELLRAGLAYFTCTLRHDPVSLILILSGLIAGFASGKTIQRIIALSIVLHLLYLFKIGGDFMSGRFFSLPVILSIYLIGEFLERWKRPKWADPVFLAAACLSFIAGPVQKLPGVSPQHWDFWEESGVSDERGYYHAQTNPFVTNYSPYPLDPNAAAGIVFSIFPGSAAVHNIGFFGYYAGPEKTIVDLYGLSDPLLARLPAYGRAGHLPRLLPAGYIDPSLSNLPPENILDPELRQFNRDLRTITSGPVFSLRRWKLIFQYNTRPYYSKQYLVAEECFIPLYKRFPLLSQFTEQQRQDAIFRASKKYSISCGVQGPAWLRNLVP